MKVRDPYLKYWIMGLFYLQKNTFVCLPQYFFYTFPITGRGMWNPNNSTEMRVPYCIFRKVRFYRRVQFSGTAASIVQSLKRERESAQKKRSCRKLTHSDALSIWLWVLIFTGWAKSLSPRKKDENGIPLSI